MTRRDPSDGWRRGRAAVWLAFTTTVLTATVPQAGHAQTSALTDLARARLVSADLVRFELTGGDVVEGRLVAITNEEFLLNTGRAVAAREIAIAEALRRRTAPLAVRGAILGGALGVGFALAARSPGDRLLAAEIGLAAGVLGGAAAGALLGRSRFDRDTVYTAPAVADARPTGLVEYRLGGNRGAIRSKIALTPFVGSASYGDRTERQLGDGDAVTFGLAQTQEIGLLLHYALGPRVTARLGGSVLRGNPRQGSTTGGTQGILIVEPAFWLMRAETGIEFRMRADVPGYFLLVADGLYNPEGYVLGVVDGRVRATGEDAGVLPRIGLGIGYDIFGPADRRIRFEWSYRVGRYHHPDLTGGYDTSRITRDWSLTLGFHMPLAGRRADLR